MDPALEKESSLLLERLPFSIEMPAGTGKTQLVAGMAATAARSGRHTLLLTHTNAGVAALRKRLKDFGVGKNSVHVDTIDGWAFELARHYPVLAGIKIDGPPDWSETPRYREGAVAVTAARAIQRMLATSFDHLFVDEYQDCNLVQHQLVRSMAQAIPRTAVFGDRLQGIFDFRGQKLVDWDEQVFPHYPQIARAHTPWRWAGYNTELGQWLLDVRPQLIPGETIDFSTIAIPGLTWVQTSQDAIPTAAFSIKRNDETALILNQWRPDNVRTASRLNGMYSVMEDLNGNFMREALSALEAADPDSYALWLAQFAKSCFSGLADINQAVLSRLEKRRSLEGLSRPGLETTMNALEKLREDPSLSALAKAMNDVERAKEGKLYCVEAWHDSMAAIRSAGEDVDSALVDRLAIIRDRLRYTGRRRQQRIISRTLLVKGLEYDHAIVCAAHNIGSVRNLYVAMTRPRRTLTIISDSPRVRLK